MPVQHKQVFVELTDGTEGVIPGLDASDLTTLQAVFGTHVHRDTNEYPFFPTKPDGTLVEDNQDIFLRQIKRIIT